MRGPDESMWGYWLRLEQFELDTEEVEKFKENFKSEWYHVDEKFFWSAFEQNLWEQPKVLMKFYNNLLTEYNHYPTIYNLEKSKKLVLDCINILEKRFGEGAILPIVYLTSGSNFFHVNTYAVRIYSEISSIVTFKEEDCGYIDFISALFELEKDGLITIWDCDALLATNNEFIIKINLKKIKQETNREEPQDDALLQFDVGKSQITYKDKVCPIPVNSNQFYLCKKMFNTAKGEQVREIDISELADWAQNSERSVYDSQRLVNQKIEMSFGLKEFFKWKNNHVSINQKYNIG